MFRVMDPMSSSPRLSSPDRTSCLIALPAFHCTSKRLGAKIQRLIRNGTVIHLGTVLVWGALLEVEFVGQLACVDTVVLKWLESIVSSDEPDSIFSPT